MRNWRKTREYRIWRINVIKRDKRCVICGTIKNRHAHHVYHATYFENIRYDVENGICLCSKCHMNFHCNFKRSYRTKCTEYDFNNFLVLIQYIKGLF